MKSNEDKSENQGMTLSFSYEQPKERTKEGFEALDWIVVGEDSKPEPMEHQFSADLDIDYCEKNNRFYILVDPDREIWASISKEDILYMAKKIGVLK